MSPLCISEIFTFRIYYLPHVPSPKCILVKETEVTSDVWQREMQSCGDKRSTYNGENKTKEESTLVNTMDNLFCSFIINDDANTAFRHVVGKCKKQNYGG